MLRLARTAAILASFSAVVVYVDFQFFLNRPIFPEITPGLTGSPKEFQRKAGIFPDPIPFLSPNRVKVLVYRYNLTPLRNNYQ